MAVRRFFPVLFPALLAFGLGLFLACPCPAWAAKAKNAGESAPSDAKAGHSRPAKDKAKAPRKVQVTDVQVYSGRDYSRIVLVLSGEAQRRWQLLPPDPKDNGVRRLYVDLEGAAIRPGVPSRFDVRGDVARKVRLSYFKPDVARLVVEVENLKAQQVFELENPRRVIVDVQGEPSARPGGASNRAKAPDKAEGRAKTREPDKDRASKAAPPGDGGDAQTGSPGATLATAGRRKMARQLVEQLGLTVRTVVVDAGHGGRDPGARGPGGLYEKNVTLAVARLLGRRLEQMGLKVIYTRSTDKYVPLEARTALANARQADLFLSVHCNAHPDPASSGLETYSLNLASTADDVRVAARENSVDPRRISDMQKILDDLMHASKLTESCDFAKSAHAATLAQARACLNQRDRGTHEAPFYVLLGARMPAILVEIGYITNPAEAAKMRDEKYLEAVAKGLAEGVRSYKERIGRYAQK